MVETTSQRKGCNLDLTKNQRISYKKGNPLDSTIRKIEWNMRLGLSLLEEATETRLADILILLVPG